MENSSSFPFVLGLIATVILLNLVSCYGQVLFIFGDSLYDAGNKQYLTAAVVPANHPPYGMSIGESTGRWSDGLIVPDFLAERLGIPLIPPVLNEKANLSHGANFATADATVLGVHLETMSLTDQILKFNQNKDKWTSKEKASALYLFYIGSDDYLNYTKTHSDPTPEQQQSFINQVIQQIEKVLVAIHEIGGRKFAFQNLAALGCLPIVKQQYESGDQCVELLSNMAAQHNKNLLQTLEKLSDTLDGFQYSIFDYFSSTVRRVNRHENYRYFTADIACCGMGSHNAYGCGFKNDSKVCSDPRGYLFFDGKHNTEKANEQMAQLIWSADPVIIGPGNLRELFVFPLTSTTGVERKSRNHQAYQL